MLVSILVGHRAVHHRLREALYGSKGRFQVVGDIRHEIALHLVCAAYFGGHFVEALGQPGQFIVAFDRNALAVVAARHRGSPFREPGDWP